MQTSFDPSPKNNNAATKSLSSISNNSNKFINYANPPPMAALNGQLVTHPNGQMYLI